MTARSTRCTVPHLIDRLTAAGGYMNTFGPTDDGNLLLEAAHTLAAVTWNVLELAAHVDGLRVAFRDAGLLDCDHDELLREAVNLAIGAVS